MVKRKSIIEMPIFCISLERCTERRELMKSEFNRSGLKFEFFNATDGHDLNVPQDSVKYGTFSANCILGCMISHRSLMRMARDRGETSIIVFEDDVVFCNDFKERIAYINGLNLEFDMFLLGGGFDVFKEWTQSTPWNHIFKNKRMNGAWGYIVTAPVMDFIINNMNYNYGVDEFFSLFLYLNFKCYSFIPFLVGSRECKSEITGYAYKKDNTLYQHEAISDFNIPYTPISHTEDEKPIKNNDGYREKWLKENP